MLRKLSYLISVLDTKTTLDDSFSHVSYTEK